MIKLLFCLIPLILVPTTKITPIKPTQTYTVTFETVWAIDPNGYLESFSAPAFDTNLGTLVGVTGSFRAKAALDLAVENLDNNSNTITPNGITVDTHVVLTHDGTWTSTNHNGEFTSADKRRTANGAPVFNLGGYDNVYDFGGTSGDIQTQSPSYSGYSYFTIPSGDISRFADTYEGSDLKLFCSRTSGSIHTSWTAGSPSFGSRV